MNYEMIQMFDPKRHYNKYKDEYQIKVQKIMDHGMFINGPEVAEIESKCAKTVHVPYAVGVSSGTDALLIALMAIGVKAGDDVVTTSFTWISTGEVIKLLGANPIFCDVEKDTYMMDPISLAKCLTKKTVAVIPVSLFGRMYDVDEINTVVRQYEKENGFLEGVISIIEDGAQSFGASDEKGRMSCGVATIGCTSFFPSKPLGCFGDGGMCFTSDERLYVIMKAIRNHGCIKRYEYERVGVNGRLDTIQAGVLLAKHPHLTNFIHLRNVNASVYSEHFHDLPMVLPTSKGVHAFAQYTIKLENETTRDDLKNYLEKNGISCSVFYPVCLHLVECLTTSYQEGDLPVAEQLSKTVLSLPNYPELEDVERQKVISVVRSYFGQ